MFCFVLDMIFLLPDFWMKMVPRILKMKKDHKEIFQALLKKFEVSYHWQETLAAPSTEFEER